MPRHIEVHLQRRGLTTRARLLDDQAPETCQALWEMLPIEAPTIHAWKSGCELYVVFPWERPPVPRENQTVHVQAGDLFFYYAPWYHAGANPSGEIAIFYDRDSQPLGGNGLMAGTLVATIEDDLPAFARACEEIWRDGADRLTIRKGDGGRVLGLGGREPANTTDNEQANEANFPRTASRNAAPSPVPQGPTPNAQPLRLEVVGHNLAVTVELLDAVAPETCAAIRATLPIEAATYHSKRSGPEVYVTLPPLGIGADENLTTAPAAADLLAFDFPPRYRGVPFDRPDLRERGYTQIGFYYRDGAEPTGPEGPIAGTRFGRVVGDVARLAELCAASKSSGRMRLRLASD